MMGNHSVGAAMHAAASAFWVAMGETKPTKEQALAALDAAGEVFRGADAEFDDHASLPEEPLFRLIAVAFDATPEEIASASPPEDADDGWEAWYDGPYDRFRKRYEFC